MRVRSRVVLGCVITFTAVLQSIVVFGAVSTLDERVIDPVSAFVIDTSAERFGSLDIWSDFQLASEFYDAQEFDSAFVYFNSIVIANPNIADAYLGRGLCYLTYKAKIDSAIGDFRKSLEIVPENVAAYNDLAIAYLAIDQLDSARNNLDLALSINPNYPLPHFNYGLLYDTLGWFDSSLASFTEAISLGLETPGAYVMQGLAYHQLKRKSHSLNSMIQAMEIDSTYWQGLYYQGRIYQEGDAPEMATIKYSTAIEYAPDQPALYYSRGVAYRSDDKFKKSLKDFDILDELTREPCLSKAERGNVYLYQALYDSAVYFYSEALSCDSSSNDLYVLRAAAFSALGDCKNAERDYDRALEYDSTNITASSGRIQCLEELAEYDKLIIHYSRMIEEDTADHESRFFRGRAYLRKGRVSYAFRDFNYLVEVVESDYFPLLYRAIAYERQGKLEPAIADYEAYLRNYRIYSPEAAFFKCRAMIEIEQFDGVVEELETIREIRGDPVNRLLMSALRPNQREKENLRELEFTDVELHYYLGLAHAGVGKYRIAEKRIRSVIRENKSDIRMHYALGIIYEGWGKKTKAKKSYKEVLKLGKRESNEIIEKARTRLEALGG